MNEDNEIVNNLGNVEKKSTRSKADKKKSKIQDQGEKKESGPASVSMKNMCSGNNRGKDGMLKTEDNDKTDSALKNPQEVCSNSSKGQIVIAILTAIIAGLVVAFFAPNIQDWHDARRRIKEQDESLERIQIGMNRGHIDDLFGNPLFINNVDADYTIKAGGKFQSAAYKLHEKSLLCLYQDDTLAACVVMTRKTDQYTFERYGLYKEGTNPSEYTFTVSDFTYEEYNGSHITDFKGYYPIMGSYHIMYYVNNDNPEKWYDECKDAISSAAVDSFNTSVIEGDEHALVTKDSVISWAKKTREKTVATQQANISANSK